MRHRYALIVGLAAILIFPAAALAATFKSGNTSSVPSGTTIGDDLFIAGGNVSVSGTVDGDLFIAGGNVHVTGHVTGDVFAAGGQVTIDGTVGESVRVAGGDISISGQIGRNLSVAGGSVSVEDGSIVAGYIDAAGGSVILAGASGPVQAVTNNLTIASSAKVKGDLTYTSRRIAEIDSGATISGSTTHRLPKNNGRARHGAAFIGGLFFLLSYLVMALLFRWLLPAKSVALATDYRKRLGSNLLIGFLTLIATPIAIVLVFITLIGWPLALIALAAYLVLLYLSLLVTAISTGHWILSLRDESEGASAGIVAPTVLGVLVIFLLWLIPWLGGIIVFVLAMVGLGALVRFDWALLEKLRKGKQL